MQTLISISPRFGTGLTGRSLLHGGVDAVGCAYHESGREGANGAEDTSVSGFEQRVAAFIFERERRGGTASGSEEVMQLLRNVAFHDGEAFACEVLELAGQARDFDVVDYEVYREVASTPLNA